MIMLRGGSLFLLLRSVFIYIQICSLYIYIYIYIAAFINICRFLDQCCQMLNVVDSKIDIY